MPSTANDNEMLLAARLRLPQHVVYRAFPAETVMLNLQTGRYHGLNATAGRMLAELEQAQSVREAAVALAGVYQQEQELIERDLCALCRSLLERELIESDGGPPS